MNYAIRYDNDDNDDDDDDDDDDNNSHCAAIQCSDSARQLSTRCRPLATNGTIVFSFLLSF